MPNLWGLNKWKDYSRTIRSIDSLEEKNAFVDAFIEHHWGRNSVGIVILSGAGGLLAVEEIWRSGYLVSSFLAVLNLSPWVAIGIVAGIFIGRWTTKWELAHIKENINISLGKVEGLTLSGCLPWTGFLLGWFLCAIPGILFRGVLEFIYLVENPSLVWTATGTAMLVHGIHHLLWWNNAKQRTELLMFLWQALGLVKTDR